MLGNRQGAVGQSLQVTWRENWEQLRPITQKTMSGEAVYHEIFRSKPPDMGRPRPRISPFATVLSEMKTARFSA